MVLEFAYSVMDIVWIAIAMVAAFVLGSKFLKSTEISMALAGVVAVIISWAHGWTVQPIKVIVEGLFTNMDLAMTFIFATLFINVYATSGAMNAITRGIVGNIKSKWLILACMAVLMLIPGAFNSVQLAKVSREMDFKQVFRSNIGGVVLSGVAGIILAYCGAGLWALVAQTLLNVVFACTVMFITVKWRPKLVCNLRRVKVLFAFGWKLLVSSLLDTLYQDLRSLVIGKKYDAGTLGYYNRGKQFPQFFISAVNGTVQSVMLPAMSAKQDEPEKVKDLMRSSVTLSSYVIFPMMAGLAAVAPALVELLLTEKWLPCVPYMQIYCFSLAFYPVHSCNLQAINAMGRSDIFLKLEISKRASA